MVCRLLRSRRGIAGGLCALRHAVVRVLQAAQKDLPLPSPAFWWEGPSGAKVLSYRPTIGWYGSERVELPKRLDDILNDATGRELHNVPVFFGLGNHGGGPTRRMLARHSRLGKGASGNPGDLLWLASILPCATPGESGRAIPVASRRIELLPPRVLCIDAEAQSSVSSNRGAPASRAERTDAAISASLGTKPADTHAAWDTILFNAFHDILPGSSIERAYDDQLAWLGGAKHAAQKIEFDALNALAARIDTRVSKVPDDHPTAVAALVWNPHAFDYDGFVEIEAPLDYRPIWKYAGKADRLPVQLLDADGKPNRFQVIAEEHLVAQGIPWRRRVVAPVKVPAMGWSVLELGWVEKPKLARRPRVRANAIGKHAIDNGVYRISAKPGQNGIRIWHKGKQLFGSKGLHAAVFDDPWGAWGGMQEEPESLHINSLREIWKIDRVQILEKGPERAALWIRLKGERSWLDLTMRLSAGRDAIDIDGRVLWTEPSARLKLIMPGAVGSRIRRSRGQRQTRAQRRSPRRAMGAPFTRSGRFGFASDALYCFSCDDNALSVTIVRSPRYASEMKLAEHELPWRRI